MIVHGENPFVVILSGFCNSSISLSQGFSLLFRHFSLFFPHFFRSPFVILGKLKRANMAYADTRALSDEDAAAAKALANALASLITKNEFTKPEGIFAYAMGDKKRQAKAWKQFGPQIIKEQELKYSRPTKEEMLRWDLKSYAYIIR